MSVRKMVCGAAGALLLGFGPALAQDHAAHQDQARLMKGASMAIEGCVTAGENDDTYVLGAVKEIPGRPIQTGLRRFYWLDSVDDLRGKAGQIVRIEGRIDEIEEGKIEIKPGKAADGGTLVELEGPGRDVDTTPAAAGLRTARHTAHTPKTTITVIRLDVDRITAVRACGGDFQGTAR